MKFGHVPLSEAKGAILAHSVSLSGGRLRKGLILEADHLAALARDGYDGVTVARLGPGDIHEDAAAMRLAQALVPAPEQARLRLSGSSTGRVNLMADAPGVVVMPPAAIIGVNQVDPAITLATVPAWRQVRSGGMVATVKIISYAVTEDRLQRACCAAAGALRVQPPVYRDATLILTDASGAVPEEQAAKLAEKGRRAVRGRLDVLGMTLRETLRVPHETRALADAIAQARGEMILILTATATSDARDVAPEALRSAGGRLERFGIPVDPGNLLFLGAHGTRPVIGLPGSARSSVLHGADWMLARVACGLPPSFKEIAEMGVGGLLKEMPTRPMPRKGPASSRS